MLGHGMFSAKKQVCHLHQVHDGGSRPVSEMDAMRQHQKEENNFLQQFRRFWQEGRSLLATSSLTGRQH